ncbi:transmembrane protein 200A [Clupea harengus]|uniref:Transmembrane protein 200A n=1 Tax=Clupea harengus TaxID=7950 RepID=A0A6P3W1A0_CLUHA|nr:transmembrane protein 200A [Clupea harengus]XP_031441701.1 transmembrane protein 200A [Clupea harengus]
MKTQTTNPEGRTPTRQRLSRFRIRSRKKKEGVIQGKLRIKSLPGAFLVLGVVVVVVGTALAVAGYWPYRSQRSSLPGQGGVVLTDSQGSGWGLLTAASLIHSERMKLLGPVIMGVGLFILICANTVLYENRDRETQMLLAQMRNVICSVSAVVPSADLAELAVSSLTARHYQWVSSLPAAHLNILCLQDLTSSEPLLHVKSSIMEDDGDPANDDDPHLRRQSESTQRQRSMLKTEVVHHQESASTPSIPTLSSNSGNSSKADLNEGGTQGRASPGEQRHHEAPHKLSNCLTASSMSTLEGEDWEVASVVAPRRSQSLSYRTNPRRVSHEVTLRMDVTADDDSADAPGRVPRECGSEVCVNMAAGMAPDEAFELASVEEQRHRSWPRLDLGYARRYLKLENKEDSVDKLLEQLEQQCSPWDKSFGSGPFQ